MVTVHACVQAYLLDTAEMAEAVYTKREKKPAFLGGEAFSQQALAAVSIPAT
jgi:hypothetical protein